MVQVLVVNNNLVKIILPSGKIFSVTTDDGTALEIAKRIIDWSEVFDREDRAQEPTNSGLYQGGEEVAE